MDVSPTNRRANEPRAWVPVAAVLAVAAAAVATTWFTMRPMEYSGRPAQPLEQEVVTAPPLSVPDTSVVGGPPAPRTCEHCGVVESVAVVDGHSAYQLRVRMHDGRMQTLKQAQPVVAGVQVLVENGVARPLRAPLQS